MRHSKESIVGTYKKLVAKNGGALVGARVFQRETGIPKYAWNGGYWRSWAAFQEDIGYAPTAPTPRTADDVVLSSFAQLAVELRRLPTESDLDLKRKTDPSFPNKSVFRRWGSRDELLNRVRDFCEDRPEFAIASELLEAATSRNVDSRLAGLQVSGFVYLVRSGKRYKIGRTNATGRRLRELAIQLPEKPSHVHVIETDDPEGIEQYWHRRFASKREGGEWFSLSQDDIKAFKRRRFQ